MPDPQLFAEFDDYEQAVLDWKVRVPFGCYLFSDLLCHYYVCVFVVCNKTLAHDMLGGVQLPTVLGRALYRPRIYKALTSLPSLLLSLLLFSLPVY